MENRPRAFRTLKGRLDPTGINLRDWGATAVCPPRKVTMNKIRLKVFVVCAAVVLAAGGLHAQTSIQNLTFSLLAQYQTNIIGTNTENQDDRIHTILITTHSVIKAIAVDLQGTNWTNYGSGELVREVNLTNGHEGIFLHINGTNQTNVSSFFGGSFTNNFMGALTNEFPGATNNFVPPFLLDRGTILASGSTLTTNFIRTAGIYYLSLNTTNLKLNLVGVGDGYVTNLTGTLDGTVYERPIDWQYLGTAGTFYINMATNFFDLGTNPPEFVSGPIRGTFTTTQPGFSLIPGP